MAKEAIEAYLEVMHEDGPRSRPSTAAASPSTRREPRAHPQSQGQRLRSRTGSRLYAPSRNRSNTWVL
jgi:hypothetical protein